MQTSSNKRKSVCIASPVYNEVEGISEFYRRTSKVLDELSETYDCSLILVNDGSTDGTADILNDLALEDPRVGVIHLSRNFGHQLAITAGVDESDADAVIVIDADLQDPPEIVVDMLKKWEEGWEVVYGVRSARAGESRFKKFSASAFYRTVNRLSDTPLPLDSGDFRLMDRNVVIALRAMREENRYVRGMVSWVGFRQSPHEYQRDARYAGETKYTLGKMVRFATNGITGFSEKPLRLAMQIGFLTTILSSFAVMAILVDKIRYPDKSLPGFASLMIVVLFLGGIQLMSIGVLGEYVGRIYRESKNRPLYVVAHRRNLSNRDTIATPGH